MPGKLQSCEYLRITLQVRANTPSPPQLFSGSVSFSFFAFVKTDISLNFVLSAKEEIKQLQSHGFKVEAQQMRKLNRGQYLGIGKGSNTTLRIFALGGTPPPSSRTKFPPKKLEIRGNISLPTLQTQTPPHQKKNKKK